MESCCDIIDFNRLYWQIILYVHDNKIGKTVKTKYGICRRFGVETLDKFCGRMKYDFDVMEVLAELEMIHIDDDGNVLILNKHLTRNMKKLRKDIN